jgi:fatty-acyl-CoA synthase
MTEMAGYVTALDWRDSAEARRAGFGSPLPGVEIRIAGESGRECAPGTAGEIRVRGPGLFSGYHKQPPGTGLDGDGFFATGDLGSIDENGTFHFSGRTKDLLRVKGINVSPAEVESVLGAHPAVESAFVVGLPVDGLEQEIVALVVPRDAARFDEAGLRRHAEEALSHYKRPSRYLVIARSEIPLSGTSKPQRAELARLAEKKL